MSYYFLIFRQHFLNSWTFEIYWHCAGREAMCSLLFCRNNRSRSTNGICLSGAFNWQEQIQGNSLLCESFVFIETHFGMSTIILFSIANTKWIKSLFHRIRDPNNCTLEVCMKLIHWTKVRPVRYFHFNVFSQCSCCTLSWKRMGGSVLHYRYALLICFAGII